MRFREVGEVINRHASMSGFSVVIFDFNASVHQLHFYVMTFYLPIMNIRSNHIVVMALDGNFMKSPKFSIMGKKELG